MILRLGPEPPWDVAEPAGSLPLRSFQRVHALRLTAGGPAQEIVLDAAGTVLRGRFQHLDYDALHPPGAVPAATVRASGGALLVEMDAPRRILWIELAGEKGSGGHTLRLHRVDGDTIAEQATETAAAGRDRRVHVELTDARIALRLVSPGGQPVSLDPADLARVQVRSDPGGARIGLLEAGSPAFFWTASGEPSDEVDAGDRLAGALERLLGRIAVPPAATVDVPLVLAADAPCRFELAALAIPYHLAVQSFASGNAKEVLRFEEGRASSREVRLLLPAEATVTSAVLAADPSLRDGGPLPAGNGGSRPGAAPTETSGVRLEPGVQAAQAFTPPAAVSVSGVVLALIGLAAGTELRIELQEDVQGEPAGGMLAAGPVVLAQAGEKLWATVRFPEPVILPAQRHWLLVTASRGGAVWLARPGATPVRLLGRPSPAGLEALLQILSPAGSPAGRAPDASPPPPLELRLGATVIPASEEPEGRRSYVLTAALNQHLAARGPGSEVDVPLLFTSIVPGLLTVYPPRIVYDPPA